MKNGEKLTMRKKRDEVAANIGSEATKTFPGAAA